MNLFIFHRDLRLFDNTTLLKQMKLYAQVTPIFILTPQQTDSKINKYYSSNSVQFMAESLRELDRDCRKHGSPLYLFHGHNLDVLNSLHSLAKIKSVAFNVDYTPYALLRDQQIKQWAEKMKISVISQEDYVMHPLIQGNTRSPKSDKPFLVYTPFRKHCQQHLKVSQPNMTSVKLKAQEILTKSKQIVEHGFLSTLYQQNPSIRVHGGRQNGLKILTSLGDFKKYVQTRNTPSLPTTKLSAYLHFTTVSIREVYHRACQTLGANSHFVSQLYWREFYTNICYYFPRVLDKWDTRSFQPKFDSLEWIDDNQAMQRWKTGNTGYPIVDAAMRELNQTGFMHNRCRMIVASFLSKHLFLDWREGERYFATKQVDYSPMQNSGGWQWTVGNGTDASPYFRIFNPWLQQRTHDPDCKYIRQWVPQLRDIPNEDIHNWMTEYRKYEKKGAQKGTQQDVVVNGYRLKNTGKIEQVKLGTTGLYPKPMVDHEEARNRANSFYKKTFG